MRRGFGTESLQHLVNKVENPGEYCTRVICSVLETRKRSTGVLLIISEICSLPLKCHIMVPRIRFALMLESRPKLLSQMRPTKLSNRHHGSGGLVKEIAPVIDLLEVRT
jgi:hypothetical protein